MIYLTSLEELIDPSIWGWLIFLIILVGLIQLGFYVSLLHRQVDKRTRHLKKAINEIQGREKQLSMIYNNMRYLIGLIGVDSTERFVIRRLPDWFLYKIERTEQGYSENQILGMEVSEFCTVVLKLSDKKSHQMIARFRKALERKMRVHFEDKMQLSTGYAGTASISLIPIEIKGKITNILYVARDVTRERNWQKQLQLSEERMRLAIENVPVMIDAFDDKGNLLVWNKQCEEVTGYTAEEMEGQDNAYNLLYPDRDYRNSLLEKWKSSPNDYEDESVITCKNGAMKTIRWIHQSETSPVPGWDDWGVGIDITERRQAELALQESGQQLSSMLHNLPGMAWRLRIDEDFTILFVSEGSVDLLEISPEEVLQKNILPRDLILPEYHDLVRKETIRCVEEMVAGELIIPIRVGEKVKWVLDRFKPVRTSEKEIVMDGLLIDISDSIENEQKLQMAIEGAREGMWDWNLENDVLEINSYAQEMVGIEGRRIENASDQFFKLLHPADQKSTLQSFIEYSNGQVESYEQEYRLKSSRGEWKWILTRGRVIQRNKDGKVQRMIGTNVDIDARKRAELTLKENERRLRKLLSNLPGMVYRCQIDRDWSMAFVSEGALELTGYSAASFTSDRVKFGDIIVENDRERVWEEVQQALHEKRSYTLNYRIRKKNGAICWVWERGGELEGLEMLEGFITDVTDRIMAEERILQTVIETEDNERKRISKELHDSLGQKLTTASLNFNALKRNIKLDQNGLKKLVNGLNNLNSAIRDSRDIAHNLMPRSIENFGYVLSVESMIAEMESATEIKFEFYENLQEDRLSTSLEIHLYRITQEAINNILKHSQAKNVIIQLMRYKEDIVLTIEDDGQGFKKNEVMNGKEDFGLRGMANRVSSLNGLLRIETLPGKGTLITIEIPMTMVQL